MTFSRPGSLRVLLLCFLAFGVTALYAQQAPPANPAPQNPPGLPAAPQTPPAQNRNPFENLPQAPQPETPKPAPPKPEAPKEAPPAPGQPAATPVRPPEDVIESVVFRGARRVSQDLLRMSISSKQGDMFEKDALDRDMVALW